MRTLTPTEQRNLDRYLAESGWQYNGPTDAVARVPYLIALENLVNYMITEFGLEK